MKRNKLDYYHHSWLALYFSRKSLILCDGKLWCKWEIDTRSADHRESSQKGFYKWEKLYSFLWSHQTPTQWTAKIGVPRSIIKKHLKSDTINNWDTILWYIALNSFKYAIFTVYLYNDITREKGKLKTVYQPSS